MHCEALTWSKGDGWRRANGASADSDLVLYFGERRTLEHGDHYEGPRRCPRRRH
jgi:hypothetical protein